MQFTTVSSLCLNSLFPLHFLSISCVRARFYNNICRGKALNITYADIMCVS